jgi:hypothetical protein
LERSATVRAHTPEEAAALAVWRGYLPMWCEWCDSGLRLRYWDPNAPSMGCWPHPVAIYPVNSDHSCVRLAFSDGNSRTLLVEAQALS